MSKFINTFLRNIFATQKTENKEKVTDKTKAKVTQQKH